ncbi:MAG: LCP family protein [Clostridia bacterium]|nr:LCP family protein [Clostridia bacterium]
MNKNLKKNKNSRISKNAESKKEKNKKFNIFKFLFTILFSIILIFIILFSTCFGYYFIKEDFDVNRAFSKTINKVSLRPDEITVLVLGVSTDITTKLADTIMVCSYNPTNQKAFILSIPRDTFVGTNRNNAKGSDKINSIYSKFGAEMMVEKVEKLTGLDIDHYAVVKTEALIEIVDAIGGVEFDVPINMDYDDITQNLHIHLKSGVQLIDGEKAEQLLRFRHNNNGTSYPSNYGDNDFGRMRTQREFIKSVAKQTIKLGNIFRIPKISSAIFKNVETDMNFGTIIKYIPSALSFDMNSIKNYQLPGESKKCNSLWFYIQDSNETIKLVNDLIQNKK